MKPITVHPLKLVIAILSMGIMGYGIGSGGSTLSICLFIFLLMTAINAFAFKPVNQTDEH